DVEKAKFGRIINGDWEPGGGTTCGFLCSWLLWALGCRDARTVNRTDPAFNQFHNPQSGDQLRYLTGHNIICLQRDVTQTGTEHGAGINWKHKFPKDSKHAFRPGARSMPAARPRLGDIIAIRGDAASPDDSHVFFFLREWTEGKRTFWLTGDAG